MSKVGADWVQVRIAAADTKPAGFALCSNLCLSPRDAQSGYVGFEDT